MIDEILFKTDGYFKLLKEFSSYINKDFTIEDETISYFEQYKTMTSDNDEWIEEHFENAQIFFNTTFIYEVDNSQYVGVYTDLDGRKAIVKLYHGGEIEYLGDTLSNWVETQYHSIAKSKPEKLKKFQDDCYSLFIIPINKKFNADDLDLRIMPDNNKIFIGQEDIRAYNIDENIFKSKEYFELLKKLTDGVSTDFIIENETVNYFEQYKTISPSDDDWDEDTFEKAQLFFNTTFVYEVDTSQYVGVYTDLDGRKFIVKLYHGGEISILGDTLSNWVEKEYSKIAYNDPEKFKKFQDDCYDLFGIDSSKKFSRINALIRIIPDNNKIFIGQEDIRAYNIDEHIFKSEEYFELLKELTDWINTNFIIDDETVNYFEQYKKLLPTDDDWDENVFKCAQMYFNTEFVYEVSNSQYVGIYTDLDGRKFIVKLYHGGEFSILGETLSNWVENQYRSIVKSNPEKIKKFQADCFSLFGIDSIKKFDATEPFEIRIIPDNNKIFIGQE